MSPDREPTEDSQGHEMALVMPFVVVKSAGGPYDDDAFCAGWAMGKISAALSQSGTSWAGPVPPAYLPQLDLIAMDRGLIGSRWHAPRINLEHLADQLRAAGHEVEVEIDLTPAPAVVKAAAQDEASERRVEGLTAKASRVGAQADALYEKAHQMADAIPFGQPILTDHYSAPADRRYRDRIHSTYGKSFALSDEAQSAAVRADSAAANQAHRCDPGTILRRIDRNEAELRRWQRSMAQSNRSAHPDWFAHADAETARLADQIAYDRQQVAAAEANGLKVWAREDFAKGDMVKVRYGGVSIVKVVRVNAKSVSVHIDGRSWTDTIPYCDVLGKVTVP